MPEKKNSFSFDEKRSKAGGEDLDAEHADIVKEIEEAKGDAPAADEKVNDIDNKEEEESDESEEETDDKADEAEGSDDDSESEDDEESDVESEDDRPSRTVPLSKYQKTKKDAADKIEALTTKLTEATSALEKEKLEGSIKAKIKTFAEKHGYTEEEAADLLGIVKDLAVDPTLKGKLDIAEASAKKQEAIAAYNSDFARLVKRFPEAAAHADEIKEKAYEDGNLSKSLFEIYADQILPELKPRRKTGEVTRKAGNTRVTTSSFDINKVAAAVKAGTVGALEGLTDKQLDDVFAKLDKEGSRYSGRK